MSAPLKDNILKGAPIDVGTFMSRAVQAYYSSRDPLGVKGDFTTAPEISQMFGEMIGVWMADIWLQMGSPDAVNIIELGPGRGTLMADAMRGTSNVAGFHDALHLHLVEISPILKAKQQDALKAHEPIFHEALETLPENTPTILIANEFFDALPVRQLQRVGQGWVERVVTADVNFDHAPAPEDLLAIIPDHLKGAPQGKILELSPARTKIMTRICDIIKGNGAALIIDYGYERANYGDTLQAVSKHEPCDALDHIGAADLTAHVDFGALMAAADAPVTGPVEQGKFLTSLGVYQRMQILKSKADAKQQEALETALNRLCSADQMGALFKVMAVHSDNLNPAGF